MTIDKATMQQIIDRATEDPDFGMGLAHDPQGTLEAADIAVSAADAQAVGAALEASGESLAEPLQARISPAGLASLLGALAHQVGTFSSHHAAPDSARAGHQIAPDSARAGHQIAPDSARAGHQIAPDSARN